MEIKYTIKSIATDGTVNVAFKDNKVQNISGLPVGDKEALDRALFDYGTAYEAGLEKETIVIDPEVTKILNKVQTVEAPVVETPVIDTPVEV